MPNTKTGTQIFLQKANGKKGIQNYGFRWCICSTGAVVFAEGRFSCVSGLGSVTLLKLQYCFAN
jgi:hypothetical protein